MQTRQKQMFANFEGAAWALRNSTLTLYWSDSYKYMKNTLLKNFLKNWKALKSSQINSSDGMQIYRGRLKHLATYHPQQSHAAATHERQRQQAQPMLW